LELDKCVLVHVDGKDHALAAVGVGSASGLLAVEETGLVRGEGEIERLQVMDVLGVEVVKVRVDISTLFLRAWLLEGRLRQGVVLAQEVIVHPAAPINLQDGRIESERGSAADDDGLDWSIRTRFDRFTFGRRHALDADGSR
jgi:hypothetical protein